MPFTHDPVRESRFRGLVRAARAATLVFSLAFVTSAAALPAEAQSPGPDCLQATFDQAKAGRLVQSVIIALQHANQTGNYSVLRDLGTQSFQDRFSENQLSGIFENLRASKIDLTAILEQRPEITAASGFARPGRLFLAGHTSTQTMQLRYALTLVASRDAWRIDAFALETHLVRPASR